MTATGTSNVRIASRSPVQKSLVSDLAAGKVEPLIRSAMLIALPALPGAHAVAPFYYALYAGLASRQKTKIQDSVVSALKDREQPELSLGETIWEKASQLAGPSANTQAGRIAESALKRTYASLLEKNREVASKDPSVLIDAIGKDVTDEDFVRKFLTNYLFELILYQMRTTNQDLRYNGARAYHYAGERLRTYEDEREFRKELMDDCEALARRVTKRVSKTGLMAKLKVGAPLTEQTTDAIQQALGAALGNQSKLR